MKTTLFWALIALNVILLGGLIGPFFRGNEAMAQRGGGGRRPDLLLIPGEIVGGNSAIVYLVDTANRRLGAVGLDLRGTRLQGMAPQDLERIFDQRGPAVGNNEKGAKR